MSNTINVLHLRDSPWFDGPGRTIVETARQIDPAQVRMHVAAFQPANSELTPFAEEAARRGVTLLPVLERSALDARTIGQVVSLIDRLEIDVLHAHELRSDLLAMLCRARRPVKLVTTAHGWIGNSRKRRWLNALDRQLMRFYDRVIAVSGRVREDLLRAGVKGGRIELLHNCLMLDEYAPGSDPDILRGTLGLGRETSIVASIGRLSPEKGQSDFLRAARAVLDKGINAHFVFIGKGPEESRLRNLAEALGLSERVSFLGYRADMQVLYRGVDLVVQSSYTEGLPNVILEALWMQVPVVATRVGGTGEIIEDGVSGRLVPPGDEAALAEGMAAVLSDTASRQRFRDNGVEVIRSRFDFRQRTERMMSIYGDVTSDRRGQAS